MLNIRVLLAGVLSIAAIAGMVFLHNNVFNPPAKEARERSVVEEVAESNDAINRTVDDTESLPTDRGFLPLEPVKTEGAVKPREISVETDLFRAVLSNRGAVLSSLVLKDHKDTEGNPAEMVLSGDSGQYPLQVLFIPPSRQTTLSRQEAGFHGDELFAVNQSSSGREVVFSREYRDTRGNHFVLEKKYTFQPEEYLFRLAVTIRPTTPVSTEAATTGYMYDLTFGPRLGPPYQNLNARTDYRYFTLFGEAPKKKNYLTTEGKLRGIDEEIQWAGIHGQYFAGVIIPDEKVSLEGLTLDSREREGLGAGSTLHFQVAWKGDGAREDVFYCFFGPKMSSVLSRYSDGTRNNFGFQDDDFLQLQNSNRLLGGVSDFFGLILRALKQIVGNYGVAIILFSLLVRVVTSPVSFRNFRTYKKMIALKPKIDRIRKKHEYNSAEANRQIAELYQREKINSLERLLPILIQLPIIVALFQLFSRSFAFRNALFIPGWIENLSQPEMIGSLPFGVPLLGTSLRLLPVLMLIITVVQIRITQLPDRTSRGQQVMSYATPLLIFIILYNMPSGIILYWLFYNLLGIGEHFLFEKRFRETAA